MNLKTHLLPILVVTVLAIGCIGGVYYVNCIKIPAQKEEERLLTEARYEAAEAERAIAEASKAPEYDYTITPELPEPVVEPEQPDPTQGNVTVTEGEDGTVTVDRTWATDTEGLDKTQTPDNETSTNVGGGDKLPTNEDGKYTEPVKEPEPEQPKTPEKPAEKAPKNGDRRIVDGKEYDYWEGFGWVEYLGPSETTPFELELSGETVPNAEF